MSMAMFNSYVELPDGISTIDDSHIYHTLSIDDPYIHHTQCSKRMKYHVLGGRTINQLMFGDRATRVPAC